MKDEQNASKANLKRLDSIRNLKKAYQNKKSLVHYALSNIDEATKNKIIFGDSIETPSPNNQKQDVNPTKSKKPLFDDQSDDNLDTEENDFKVKEKFEGEKGQKLLELQSKYKNDNRFNLDVRFLDDSEEEQNHSVTIDQDSAELSFEEEKKKEYEILEQVLGTKINPKNQTGRKIDSSIKSMLRFDPTQPEHSKYELKEETLQNKKKKCKKNKDSALIVDTKQEEEKEVPSVSKDVFYKVNENLKESLNQNEGFSLLNMFGTVKEAEENDDKTDRLVEKIDKKTRSQLGPIVNPFRYDSSDEEDEIKDATQQEKQNEEKFTKVQSENRRHFWTEPFFFVDDDYRLQEGFDFIEKIKSEDNTEFAKVRRDLKQIVKAKVRNNQAKKKPFKRKLGGSKKRKMIRIKKALKK